MSTPENYGSLTEEIKKASQAKVWTEETVEILLASTLNGGLKAIADAHNATVQQPRDLLWQYHNDVAFQAFVDRACAEKLEVYKQHHHQQDDTKRLDWPAIDAAMKGKGK